MSLALPCAMRAFRGTKWYRRLICAEYSITLDVPGAAPMARDASLAAAASDDGRLTVYEEAIVEAFETQGRAWDDESPFGLVHRFRELKGSLFSRAELDYGCLAPRASPTEAIADPRAADYLRSAHGGAGLVVLPDCDRPYLAPELANAAARLSGRGAEPRLALGPALGDWPPAIERRASISLAPWWSLEPTDLEALAEPGQVVVCADLRYAYALIACGIPSVTLLDDGDWYGAVLRAANRSADDGISYPPGSAYGALLRPVGRPIGGFRFQYWGEAVPERERSGLYPLGGRLPLAPAWPEASAGFMSRSDNWAPAEAPGPGVVHAAWALARAIGVGPEYYGAMTAPGDARGDAGGDETGRARSDEAGRSLLLSFNYYMTDNLLARSASHPDGIPAWRRFMLDYLLERRIAPGYESVPLYRKALLGLSDDGRLFAGDFVPAVIRLYSSDGNTRLAFEGPTLDPEDQSAPGLFRPVGGPRSVGARRWCTTFVHDRVWSSGLGPVAVPAFGVVVVSERPLDLGPAPRWEVDWEGLPCPKERVDWLVGGFNALVLGGRNLCDDDEAAARRLRAEGWENPLSMETQETQLLSGVRQPRCCVGATVSGKVLALCVSGRSVLSEGATFAELASLAQALAERRGERLDFLINLDGGASAMLYATGPGVSTLLSIPSPSDNNPAGVARKVPALLRIRLPEET